jgi:hypothetical protein
MKYVLFFFFLIASISGQAQYDSTKVLQAQNAYGFFWKNMKVITGGSLILPADTPHMAIADTGAIVIMTGGRAFTWKLNHTLNKLRWEGLAGNVARLTDSTFIIGMDTMKIVGTSSGSIPNLQQVLTAGNSITNINQVITGGDTTNLNFEFFHNYGFDFAHNFIAESEVANTQIYADNSEIHFYAPDSVKINAPTKGFSVKPPSKFQDTVTITTMGTGDSSKRAASTEWVRMQHYGGGGSGGSVWGSITGTLSSQTDLNTALAAKEATSNKNANNGYAGLNSSGLVPVAHLGTGTPTGTKFLRDDNTFQTPPGTGTDSSDVPGYGMQIVKAGTVRTHKVDTSLIQTKITQWPAETTVGTLFYRNFFLDTLDFDKHGSVTMSKNGSYLDMSNGDAAAPYDNYVTWGTPHLLLNAKIEVITKLTGALSSTSYGQFRPGFKSINTALNDPHDMFMSFPTTNSGSAGVYILNQSGTIIATSAGAVTYSQNDSIKLRLELKDSVITATVINMTVGGADSSTVSYSFSPVSGTTQFRPNTARFALYGIGTATEQLHSVTFSSTVVKNPNVLALGPSRTMPIFEDFWAHGWPQLLNGNYPSVNIFGGGSDGINEFAANMYWVKFINPRIVIFSDAIVNTKRGNPTGNEAVWFKTYDSCVQVMNDAGITVYHFNIPEDSLLSGIGSTEINNYIKAKYASNYIDVWDSIGQGTNIMAAIYQDPGAPGLHLNTLGQAKVYQTIVASGKLSTGLNRIGQLNNSDEYVIAAKGKVEFSPYSKQLLDKMRLFNTGGGGGGGVSMSSNTTNTLTMSTGANVIGDAPISTNGTKLISTQPLDVTGALSLKGPSNGLIIDNRNTSTSYWGLYADPFFHWYDVIHGLDRMTIDTSGRMFLPTFGQSISIGTSSPPSGTDKFLMFGGVSVHGLVTSTGNNSGIILPARSDSTHGYAILDEDNTNGLEFWDQVAGVQRFTFTNAVGFKAPFIASATSANVVYYNTSTGDFTYGAASGSGGNPNSNVGSAFRWAIPGTNNIKTYAAGPWIIHDSATTNQNRTSVDTAAAVARIRQIIADSLNAFRSNLSIVYEKTFTTTDATPINVDTISIAPGESVTVHITMNAGKDNGHASVDAERFMTFLFDDGSSLHSTSLHTQQVEEYLGTGLSSASFTMVASGTHALIQFTGEASTTIKGKMTETITRNAIPL